MANLNCYNKAMVVTVTWYMIITSIEPLFNSKLYLSVDSAGVLHYPTTILWLPVL